MEKARVTIEHVNGLLKARLCSLRGFRIPIREHSDFQLFCQNVIVCIILHNMMMKFNDSDFEYSLEEDNDDIDKEEAMLQQALDPTLEPVDFRTKLQVLMLNRLLK